MFSNPRGSILGNVQLTIEEIEALLMRNPYGTLAVIGENGYPSAIPLNFAYHDHALYFHTADRGEKIENIKKNPRVCVNVYEVADDIGKQVISAHKSVTAYGIAEILEGEDMVEALRYIAKSAHMPYKAEDAYIYPRMKGIVGVRISIEHMTGRVVKFGGQDAKRPNP